MSRCIWWATFSSFPSARSVSERNVVAAHAAVDVVADPAGREDARLHLHGGDTAGRETVAAVGVRHGDRISNDPRQMGDVGGLFERAVGLDLRNHVGRGIDARQHAHSSGRGNFERRRADLGEPNHDAEILFQCSGTFCVPVAALRHLVRTPRFVRDQLPRGIAILRQAAPQE
jgi:hypothetical protein